MQLRLLLNTARRLSRMSWEMAGTCGKRCSSARLSTSLRPAST
jgi:hypothetical protein